MNYKFVELNKGNDGIAHLRLNDPDRLNPMSIDLMESVLAALNHCEEDHDVRVVALTGAGKHFSGGGDINEMITNISTNKAAFERSMELVPQLTKALKRLSKPVIASVHGAVMGGAFNLALSCDFCIAAEDAKFSLAFVNLGLIPDTGGMFLLSRVMGVNSAMHLALTGNTINAKRAYDLGLLYETCPQEALEERTVSLARRLACGPSVAYKHIKQMMYEVQFSGFDAYAVREKETQILCSETEDCWEAITAFSERRAPIFKGR